MWVVFGFFNLVIWLIFVVFMFGIGYEKIGFGCCIVLILVKKMGYCMLFFGYVVMFFELIFVFVILFNLVCGVGIIYFIIRNLLLFY